MKSVFTILVSVSFLIVALSIGYYYVIFLPSKLKAEQDKISAEQMYRDSETKTKEAKLEACLETAYENYKNNWDLNCKEFGSDKKEAGCSLRVSISEGLEKDYKEAKDFCLERYK